MRIICTCVAVVVILSLLTGCSHFDRKAFEKAKAADTEQAYRNYIFSHPNGRYLTEAAVLAEQCAVREAVAGYQSNKEQALAAEGKGDWPQALKHWQNAIDSLDLDEEIVTGPEFEDRRKEGEQRAKQCKTVIENPITISQEKVTGKYHYKSTDPNILSTHYSSVSVSGKVTNNCPFPVSDIIILFKLVSETVLTVNTETGEDVSRGGYDTLASVERTIYQSHILQPGESARFSFKAHVSADPELTSTSESQVTFHSPEPQYTIEIKSYKAR